MAVDETIKDTVREQTEKLHAMLPELCEKGLKDRWVVFADGEVKGDFATPDEAYAFALEQFGHEAGFVVDAVRESTEPKPLSASVLFGLW